MSDGQLRKIVKLALTSRKIICGTASEIVESMLLSLSHSFTAAISEKTCACVSTRLLLEKTGGLRESHPSSLSSTPNSVF
jgi:hypothetical protein